MLDIFHELNSWVDGGEPFALGTVVQTWGSAPRGVGSAMAVKANMSVIGSVSGGCVEGDVIEAGRAVLKTGKPRLLGYGVSDETAWSVGLTCGGKITIFVEPHLAFSGRTFDLEIWQTLNSSFSNNQPAVLLTRLSEQNAEHLLVLPEGEHVGDWGRRTRPAIKTARAQYEKRQSARVELEGEDVFIHVFPRKDRLLIIGATHISIPLVKFAKELMFEVVVIDPREVFASKERFLVLPDTMTTRWPHEVLEEMDLHEDTYAVLLTHDPKIDDPALLLLLKSRVRYIGALGSRKTHAKRMERLKEAGFSEEEIARIQGPAGLDIHADNPTEIALSIVAQVVQAKRSV